MHDRIEKKAYEKYPVCMVYNDLAMEERDINSSERETYIETITEGLEKVRKVFSEEFTEDRTENFINRIIDEL